MNGRRTDAVYHRLVLAGTLLPQNITCRRCSCCGLLIKRPSVCGTDTAAPSALATQTALSENVISGRYGFDLLDLELYVLFAHLFPLALCLNVEISFIFSLICAVLWCTALEVWDGDSQIAVVVTPVYGKVNGVVGLHLRKTKGETPTAESCTTIP